MKGEGNCQLYIKFDLQKVHLLIIFQISYALLWEVGDVLEEISTIRIFLNLLKLLLGSYRQLAIQNI